MIEKIIEALNNKYNCNDHVFVEKEEWDSVFIRKGNGHQENLNYYYLKENNSRDEMRKELVKIYNQTFNSSSPGLYLNFILLDTIENREMIELMFFDTKRIPQFMFFNETEQHPLSYRKTSNKK